MKAISPNGTFNFIDPSERNNKPEDQTTFVCSYLSVEQESLLDDNMGYQGPEGYNLTIGKSNLLALHMGLKEILNFPDENGNPVELKRDETKFSKALPGVGRPWQMDILDRIPKETRDNVANAIKAGARLDEAETKNS